MAKKRGPDGAPIDIPSYRPPSQDKGLGEEDTWKANKASSSLFPDEPVTAPPAKRAGAEPAAKAAVEEPRTVIHGGRRNTPRTDSSVADAVEAADAMENPPAGWLVVVDGPGKGSVLTIGHGQNSMGRSPNERLCLDFGDNEISRNNHATITYDPRGRRFYVQQGTGTNLVYMGDVPVLMPMPLETHAELLIGNTRLRFIALCGAEFSWQDS